MIALLHCGVVKLSYDRRQIYAKKSALMGGIFYKSFIKCIDMVCTLWYYIVTGEHLILILEENKMSIERKNEIEKFAKEVGLSSVDAKKMLEEIESDCDANEVMAEMWY